MWRRSQSSAFRCAHVRCGFYVDRVSIFLFQISPGSLSVLRPQCLSIARNFLRPYTLEVPLPGEWSLLSLSCHVSARLVNESLIVSVILYFGPAEKSSLFAPPP